MTELAQVELADADRSALLDAIGHIGEAADLDEFARRSCDALLGLVPALSTSYNEVNLRTERVAALVWPDPGPQWYETHADFFGRHMLENPILSRVAATGDGAVATWADLDPGGAFTSTPLFRRFYAPLGIRGQAAFTLPAPPGVIVGMAVNRDGPEFSPRELRLMSELRIHLVNVYRLVSSADRERVQTAALAVDGWTVILVAGDGVVIRSTAEAVELGAAAGVDLRVGAGLASTELWSRFVATAPSAPWSVRRAPTPVVISGRGVEFEAVLVRSPVGPHVVWLREPSRVTVAGGVHLGLTRRQAEVAVLLVDGATNDQIATALGISAGTVRKHLEAVFAALEVRSRAAAAVALLRGAAG